MRRAILLATIILSISACGSDDDAASTTVETTVVETATTAPDTTSAGTSAPGTTAEPKTEAPADEDLSPSEAFCSDLEAGLTPMNIYGGVSDDYTPEEFADLAYGNAAISCPDQLTSNEALRTFLQNWGIDPDA